MKKQKRVIIQLKTLDSDVTKANDKQINYILGLLSQANKSMVFDKSDRNRLSLKQASKLIDALLKEKRFLIKDMDILQYQREKKKSAWLRSQEIKAKEKELERQKMDKAKNVEVNKVEWLPDKPKTFDNTPRISLEEQQAKLNYLTNQ